MKTALKSLKRIPGILFLLVSFTLLKAQDSASTVRSMIESKNFIFKAQTVLPASGSLRQISTDNYDVRLLGDSLISYLPYFGRAYSAPVNGEGGINFTSIKFDYSYKARKKNGWEILIRPKDVTDFREFSITVFENGNASLRAVSNNRQPISFNGRVEKAK